MIWKGENINLYSSNTLSKDNSITTHATYYHLTLLPLPHSHHSRNWCQPTITPCVKSYCCWQHINTLIHTHTHRYISDSNCRYHDYLLPSSSSFSDQRKNFQAHQKLQVRKILSLLLCTGVTAYLHKIREHTTSKNQHIQFRYLTSSPSAQSTCPQNHQQDPE